MKKITLLLLLSVSIIISCVTEKQRKRICNSCAVSSSTKDSISFKTVHDSVFVPGKDGPVIYRDSPCQELCDSLGRLKPINITAEKNGITTTIKNVNGKLAISSEKKDTLIHFDREEKEHFHSQKDVEVKQLECVKPHRTKWDGFTYWYFWITAVPGVLFIAWKLLKGRIPFLK